MFKTEYAVWVRQSAVFFHLSDMLSTLLAGCRMSAHLGGGGGGALDSRCTSYNRHTTDPLQALRKPCKDAPVTSFLNVPFPAAHKLLR